MLTRKFKLIIVTLCGFLATVLLVTILLTVNSRIDRLEHAQPVRVVVEKTVLVPTPTLTPVASPTATLRILAPVKKTVVTPTN